MNDLYKNNPTYEVHAFKSREEWLTGRDALQGVGGSDSAAAIGLSPWKSNLELWRQKTGRAKTPDLSNIEAVVYGQMAEAPIREIYSMDVALRYRVEYLPDCILKSIKHPFMLYSPDGLLEEIGTGRMGLLEIKTSTIHGNASQWKDRIPQNYYIQVLHGMAVTGAMFAELRASLKYSNDYTAVRTYHIERPEVEEDIHFITEKIAEFWEYVTADEEPPLVIGGIA